VFSAPISRAIPAAQICHYFGEIRPKKDPFCAAGIRVECPPKHFVTDLFKEANLLEGAES
jgi:hypothetical protein